MRRRWGVAATWALTTAVWVGGCTGSGGGGEGSAEGEPADFESAAQAVRETLAQKVPEGMTLQDQIDVALTGHTDQAGNALRYKKTAGGFELRSPGPDGQFDTPDDVVRQFTK